jgi:hypothetical protein
MNLPNPISFTDTTGKSFKFEALETLKSFLEDELKYWQDVLNQRTEDGLYVHNYMNTCIGIFQSAVSTISSWDELIQTWDDSSKDANLRQLCSSYLNSLNGNWIWSGHEFIKPWIDCYSISQPTGDAFLEAITRKTAVNVTTYEWFKGYLLAYEFLLQDENTITKRRNAEKASFGTIRNQLIEKKNELINEVSAYQSDLTKWKQEKQLSIDTWHKEHVSLVDQTALKHSTEFQERLSTWTEKITQLETLYKEKLRLDGPATYWNTSAKKFNDQGLKSLLALTLTSVAAIVYFGNFFLAWLQGQTVALELKTVEGVLLFAIVLSTFAFLIRVFAKLTFSSFHLQRDSEEREQLTHLYLSLAHDENFDLEARKIILQSLFSRTETGLLANESGPSMPGSVQDLISAIKVR